MFTNKNQKLEEKSTQQNILAQGAEIIGDMATQGPLRIDGIIRGNLKAHGKVVVGKTGIIDGNLEGENADFEGTLSGNLFLTGTLSLKSTARIEGEVKASKLIVEPGAIFNANCNMNTGVKTLNTNTIKPKRKRKTEQTA